jgi:hypothetical protein
MALIVASIPGRMRIRHRLFSQVAVTECLGAALAALDGVVAVEIRRTAASLIVRYDAARISAGGMERRVGEVVGAALQALGDDASGKEDARGGKRFYRHAATTLNRYAKYGMYASLPISLILAARGAGRAHALTGGIFIACLGVHLLRHHKRLID